MTCMVKDHVTCMVKDHVTCMVKDHVTCMVSVFCSDFQLILFRLQKCVLDFSRKCTQLGRAIVV